MQLPAAVPTNDSDPFWVDTVRSRFWVPRRANSWVDTLRNFYIYSAHAVISNVLKAQGLNYRPPVPKNPGWLHGGYPEMLHDDDDDTSHGIGLDLDFGVPQGPIWDFWYYRPPLLVLLSPLVAHPHMCTSSMSDSLYSFHTYCTVLD